MAEFLIELYSEEIPPQLQINARNQLKILIESSFKEKGIKFEKIEVFSTPTRLTLFANNLPDSIKIASQEIRGPKVGSPDKILEGFAKAKSYHKRLV